MNTGNIELDNSLSESIRQNFNEVYNMGIDAAINICRSQQTIYKVIPGSEITAMAIESIVTTLEYLKKTH